MKNKYLILILFLGTLASCSSTLKKENEETVNKPSTEHFNYFMGHPFHDRN